MVKTRSMADREADNQLLLQLEEKEVISSVATLLPSLSGPGEQFPIEKLHAKVMVESCTRSFDRTMITTCMFYVDVLFFCLQCFF